MRTSLPRLSGRFSFSAIPRPSGFVAAIVGGFGTFSGAIAGGLTVGVVDNLVKTFLAPELSLTIVFGLLLLVLYVRPNGFFGREVAQKV